MVAAFPAKETNAPNPYVSCNALAVDDLPTLLSEITSVSNVALIFLFLSSKLNISGV